MVLPRRVSYVSFLPAEYPQFVPGVFFVILFELFVCCMSVCVCLPACLPACLPGYLSFVRLSWENRQHVESGLLCRWQQLLVQ